MTYGSCSLKAGSDVSSPGDPPAPYLQTSDPENTDDKVFHDLLSGKT